MLYPPPEGTGIMWTKTNQIELEPANANNFAED
jgi:hypothetical protein